MLWEHKLLLEGTVSNNNGDGTENVTSGADLGGGCTGCAPPP